MQPVHVLIRPALRCFPASPPGLPEKQKPLPIAVSPSAACALLALARCVPPLRGKATCTRCKRRTSACIYQCAVCVVRSLLLHTTGSVANRRTILSCTLSLSLACPTAAGTVAHKTLSSDIRHSPFAKHRAPSTEHRDPRSIRFLRRRSSPLCPLQSPYPYPARMTSVIAIALAISSHGQRPTFDARRSTSAATRPQRRLLTSVQSNLKPSSSGCRPAHTSTPVHQDQDQYQYQYWPHPTSASAPP